jgi:pyrimidine dimer DNA glycosylase
MRLWTLHPKYLDARGLVALWREGLLAQAVLCGQTQEYRFHPQLVRFRAERAPLAAIDLRLPLPLLLERGDWLCRKVFEPYHVMKCLDKKNPTHCG